MSKNAFANIQSKNLMLAYDNYEAKVLLRCLPALSLLPISEVVQGFDDVKNALLGMELFPLLGLENNLHG